MALSSEGIINDAPQVLTANWANLGLNTIETTGYSFFGVYADLDINDSKGVQIRAVGKYDFGEAEEYLVPTNTIKKDIIEMLFKPKEFKPDEDQFRIVAFDMDQVIKLIQIQVRALTVGVTPGQITRARYRQGYRQ